jgi:hypothetical protein
MADATHGDSRLARSLKRVGKWLAQRGEHRMEVRYCPPLPLLWSFRRGDGSPASVIHKGYLREVWRERGLLGRARVLLQILLFWPAVTLAAIAWYTWLHGPGVRTASGKSCTRQAREQLRLSALHGIAPPEYYAFELHDDAKRRHAGDYLNRFETKGGLYGVLRRHRRDGSRSVVHDKAKFTRACLEQGLPVIPVLAVARKGKLRLAKGGDQSLPQQDLFVKPTRGRGGQGAEWWRYGGRDSYTNGRGDLTLSSRHLIEHIKELSREEPYLVSPRVSNHPALAELSTGALCTLRVLSVQDARGDYEATDAVFRMAAEEKSVVDNFHAGGIAANVDMATGELALATGQRPDRGWWDHHPATGAKVLGRRLPFWREVIELVRRAHAAFPGYAVIGWDIAILESGPCIVEANGAPDVDIHQRCGGRPLGSGRMGELFAFQVKQALA